MRYPCLFRAAALLTLALEPAPAAHAAGDAAAAGLEAYKARVGAALEAALAAAEPAAPQHLTPCVGGFAGGYPCSGVDLLEFLPVSGFAASATNSLWGWTDALTGKEYALLGLNNGTAFVDVSDPEAPVYLGKLPSQTGSSSWRDVRVYQNHAYVVADSNGAHGMQVFDLTQLRAVAAPPVTFTATAHYAQVANVHTISINEATGFAYLVGATQTGSGVETCHGGLHIVSLAAPAAPQFVGCYDDGAYVHENQCFVYQGPDAEHAGREICLAARGSAESIDVIDVTDHAAPVRLSSFRYQPAGVSSYSHQAWFTDDHRYVLLDDELDEENQGNATRTWILDASDLDQLALAGATGYFDHATAAIDHNLYVRGDYVFQSNYKAGLRILRLADLAQAELEEVGYFDVFPAGDGADFDGTWNNYPFFASGTVLVSHITQGLFLLRPTSLCTASAPPGALVAAAAGDRRIDLDWAPGGGAGTTFTVERAAGGCGGSFAPLASGLATPAFSDTAASGGVTYGYRVVEVDASGFCASPPTPCVEAQTTGACTEAPAFAGLAAATSAGTAWCGVRLDWPPATPFCDGPARYSVHRSPDPGFTPDAGNRIAQDLAGTRFDDFGGAAGTTYHYAVRASDPASALEEDNLVRRSAAARGPVADATFASGAEVGDPMLDTGDALAAPEHVGWHPTSARAHGGARSFSSTASNNLCVSLAANALTLAAGESPQLTFWTAYDIEGAFDGGVVEVRPAGVGPWTALAVVPGYPGAFNSGGDACGYVNGTPSFTGTDLGWSERSASLAAWAGQTIDLRFNYSTDGSQLGQGWFVDDVAVTHAQVPGLCVAAAGLFVDDFEGGSAARWSALAGLSP